LDQIIDGEWIRWDDIPDAEEDNARYLAQLEYEAALLFKFPRAKLALIPYFQDLLALAESYHRETGKHLQAYGDIGELFGAIRFGITLHDQYAQGSDGRFGDDFVEIKTITPFKRRDEVKISLDGHFSKLLVVKINEDFEVSGRMIDRSALTSRKQGSMIVTWDMLSRARRR
jgi:hypothetical protein